MSNNIESQKILLVAPYGGVPGGISRWTSHIVEYYGRCGLQDCELDLVPMGRSTFVNINSSIVYRLWSAFKDYRAILRDYHNKLRAKRYDVMHLTSSASLSLVKDLYILAQAKRCGVRSIVHFHFGRIPELALQRNWEWRLLTKVVKAADRVVVIDKMSYDTLLAEAFTNVVLLPNPVAPAVIDIVAKSATVERVPRTILFTGHVVKTKGVFELLEACSKMEKISLKLLGHITPQMQEQIETAYPEASWLTICGEKPYEEVIGEMLACDVFVLPTYTEGFPNVILESMACGCAIVTTPVGAIPEMLDIAGEAPCGVCVEPKSAEVLGTAIESLLADEEQKRLLGSRAKSRVVEQYSIESVWQQMVDIWKNC